MHTDRLACTLKFQTTAICFATFLGDVCMHSNQESRLSGAQKHNSTLSQLEKFVSVNFKFFFLLLLFIFGCKRHGCVYLGSPF